jgi:hypothetical protein
MSFQHLAESCYLDKSVGVPFDLIIESISIQSYNLNKSYVVIPGILLLLQYLLLPYSSFVHLLIWWDLCLPVFESYIYLHILHVEFL